MERQQRRKNHLLHFSHAFAYICLSFNLLQLILCIISTLNLLLIVVILPFFLHHTQPVHHTLKYLLHFPFLILSLNHSSSIFPHHSYAISFSLPFRFSVSYYLRVSIGVTEGWSGEVIDVIKRWEDRVKLGGVTEGRQRYGRGEGWACRMGWTRKTGGRLANRMIRAGRGGFV